MRPANDFVQTMYWASSSLRACTLRLPSVVWSSAFRSLNVSDSFTASALAMPSRTCSWMTRSNAGTAPLLVAARLRPVPRPSFRSFTSRAAFDLATVLPRDPVSEQHVQPAETEREQRVSPRCGSEQSDTAERDEAEPHRRQDRKSTRLNSSHLGISYAVF